MKVYKSNTYEKYQMKVSFITTTYNASDVIENTIKSVLNLKLKNFEYLIQDAGSVDHTINVCKKYSQLKIYIKEDNGIYHGMNHAIDKSSGDIIVIINAGDKIIKKGFEEVLKLFKQDKSIDIIATSVVMINRRSNKSINWFRKNNPLAIGNATVKHPAIFVHKDVYKKIGKFNLNFPISADYDFVCRALLHKLKIINLDVLTTVVDDEGYSTALSRHISKNIEHIKIVYKYSSGKKRFNYVLLTFKKAIFGLLSLLKKKL